MPKRFPAIEFIAKRGRMIAIVVAILPAIAAVILFAQHGSALQLAAGLAGAAVLYAFLRLGVELIEVIAETLLPR